MPEISDGEYRLFVRYQMLGSPDEIGTKINDLETDNRKQRDEIRDLKEKELGDGQVAISSDDHKALEKYRALGTPKEVEGKLEAGTDATTRLAGLERKQEASAFVRAAGLAGETVDTLVALPELQGVSFVVEDGKDDSDKDVKIPKLSIKGENDSVEVLDMKAALERFPSLKGLRMATPQERGGQEFYQQGPGAAPGGENQFDRIRREAEEKKKQVEQRHEGTPSAQERLGMVRPA